MLIVLVHAPEPEGEPPCIAFEEGDAEFRVSIEDAAGAEAEASVHLLDGMAGDVAHGPDMVGLIVEAVGDGLGEAALERLVKGYGDIQLLALLPQGVVDRVVPVPTLHGVRMQVGG